MNPDIKTRWLAALRSGDYRQGQGHLCTTTVNDDGTEGPRHFCCLGVLTDIVADMIPDPAWDHSETVHATGKTYRIYKAFGESSILPEPVAALTGLSGLGLLPQRIAYGEYELIFKSLARLNDAGAPFDFIANVIEEQL